MRLKRKAEQELIKYNKRLAIKKRIAAFFLIFCLYTGLAIVDYAGSEMTGYPVHFSLQIKRIDSERISISFGKLKTTFDFTAS